MFRSIWPFSGVKIILKIALKTAVPFHLHAVCTEETTQLVIKVLKF
jgi:hypothetical protein